MGLYKTAPQMSGRMGALWCLSGVRESAVVEYGCMGHMSYGRTYLHRRASSGGKLYSSHIGETDIAMGDASRLTRALEWVSRTQNVKTIFLLPSSLPETIGFDLNAFALELEPQFPDVNLIPVSCGGYDADGAKGVELTLLQLVKVFARNADRTDMPSFNIIGSCADMFAFLPDAAELIRIMSGAFGMKPVCVMSSDTGISEIKRLGTAHLNLVLRREGESAAKYLKECFGTPYILARPYGIEGTVRWIQEIGTHLNINADSEFMEREKKLAGEHIEPIRPVMARFLRAHKEESRLILAGHADVAEGMSGAFGQLFGEVVRYCDASDMATDELKYLNDESKIALSNDDKGFLMGSGELLRMAGRDSRMQIALPDDLWRHAYEPPLVGFRGTMNLFTIWINEMMTKS